MKTINLTRSVRTVAFFIGAPLLSSALAFNAQADHHAGNGDQVRIPVGHTTQTWNGSLPKRGFTKAQVEENFGQPATEEGPSGTPPIYFWEYPDFTVYFEGNHVIHTVVKTR